jgi:hypothetical protein
VFPLQLAVEDKRDGLDGDLGLWGLEWSIFEGFASLGVFEAKFEVYRISSTVFINKFSEF